MSLVASITKDLKEKIENLNAKTSEQPLVHIYGWIRNNAKLLLFESMMDSVPEEKRNGLISQILQRFVESLEKCAFDNLVYAEYSEKMKSCVSHAAGICKSLFTEISKCGTGDPTQAILDVCYLLQMLPVPTFLNRMLPDHPIYGTHESASFDKKMKREEREKEIKELFPKNNVKCPKCKKSDDIRFTTYQRRSWDEPADEKYFCVPCQETFHYVKL